MEIVSKEQLIHQVKQGAPVEYLFFWGPGNRGDAVSRSCLCQWYYSPFVVDGITYTTAEHYMMAEKARLFGDEIMRQRIIEAPEPLDAQMLGRHVKGYIESVWQEYRFDIVVAGSIAKFSQHAKLARFLLDTGDKVLVEASPVGAIWGVALSEDDPDIRNPACWKGQNLLGFAQMVARDKLRSEAPI